MRQAAFDAGAQDRIAQQAAAKENHLSNCCGAPFTFPGWPESDICSRCKEHAGLDTVEEAARRLLHATLVEADWKRRNPSSHFSTRASSKEPAAERELHQGIERGLPGGPAKKPAKPAPLAKVASIGDLQHKAILDPRYHELALIAASNLGGNPENLDSAIRTFWDNSTEGGTEEGVVDEINFCLDLVGAASTASYRDKLRSERLSKDFQRRLAGRSQYS